MYHHKTFPPCREQKAPILTIGATLASQKDAIFVSQAT